VQIFLSYESSNRPIANEIFYALESEGHRVFIDRADLPPGRGFHHRIREALRASQLMVFLLTRGALEPGSYTLTEIKIAESVWRSPDGHVLVVDLESVPNRSVPEYLRATTFLVPSGNVAAEVAIAVERLAPRPDRAEAGGFKCIKMAVVHRGTLLEAQANRPITTKMWLRVDGEVLLDVTRPWTASIAAAIATLIGRRSRWRLEGDGKVGGKTVSVRAEFVTTFTDQYFEIFVEDELITPDRIRDAVDRGDVG
jgi:hypothetical protein